MMRRRVMTRIQHSRRRLVSTACRTLVLFVFGAIVLHAQTPVNQGMETGTGKWMQIADNASIALPVFTAECWVQFQSGGLIVTRDHSAGTPSDWQVWCEWSRKRLAFITALNGPPDSYYYTADNTITQGVWYHIALAVNGPQGRARLYLNGVLQISPSFAPRRFDAVTGLAWGGYFNNSTGAYLNARMDEARYWNYERTEQQINANMRRTLPLSERVGLMGYWMFCGDFADSSGNRNHVTPSGNPSIVDIPELPFTPCCKDGAAPPTITRNNDTLLCSAARSYQWRFEGIDLPGETRQRLHTPWIGRYTVVITDSNGCTASADFVVGALPLTVQTGPGRSVCPDSCAVLSASVSGGHPPYRYAWSPPVGIAHPDSAVTMVCPRATTTYTVNITDSAGTSVFSSVTVTLFPRPAPAAMTRSGDTLESSPAFSYQWYCDGVPIPGETGRRVVIRKSGSYTVRISDGNGCPSGSDTVRIQRDAVQVTLGLGCPDSTTYKSGTIVIIPLSVSSISPVLAMDVSRIDAYLHFDRNVLFPVADSNVVYVDRDRVRLTHCSFLPSAGFSTGVFGVFRAMVMLGDTACTDIVLDSVVSTSPEQVIVVLKDTLCRVCVKLCEEGGARLYRSYGNPHLFRNHPNPFNAQTTFEYELAAASSVRLDIHDMLGRRVTAIDAGALPAGRHRLAFDAGALPSGFYIAVLRTNDSIRTTGIMIAR
jgi:hypothetical protein